MKKKSNLLHQNVIRGISMKLFKSAKDITPVSSIASEEYKKNQETLRRLVDEELASFPEIYQIIGNNPLQVMYDNHYYHAVFMGTILKLNNYQLLARMFIWIYRVYCGRGFQYNYFQTDLHVWQKVINKVLTKESAWEITAVYKWLIMNHDDLINLATSDEYRVFSDINMSEINYIFLMYLLQGDYKACLAMAEQYLKEDNDLTALYLQVFQPCLYEIGRLWEGGQVSVAQEHLATAIVARVMLIGSAHAADCYMGKAVIVCAPSELHELGVRMVADLLEKDGWQVDFLGASLPAAELVQYLQSSSTHFVGIAASMPFNLDSAREGIEAIRQDSVLKKLKIMVGGPAFHHEEMSWRQMGADAYAVDGAAAVAIAKKWRSIKG